VPLAVGSRALWHRIAGPVGGACDFQAFGHVKVAETPAGLAELEQRAATTRAVGWAHGAVVDAAELRPLLPAIAAHAVGRMVARRNGFAHPYRTALACRAQQRRPAITGGRSSVDALYSAKQLAEDGLQIPITAWGTTIVTCRAASRPRSASAASVPKWILRLSLPRRMGSRCAAACYAWPTDARPRARVRPADAEEALCGRPRQTARS
jgi:hypothetical protein